MLLRTRSLGTLTALVLGLSPAASAGNGFLVEFGDTITQPGVYFLNGDQTGSGCGVLIESDYVTLILGNHTLTGDGSEAGIEAEDRQGLAIIGGRITNFEDGIALDGCSRSLIEGVRVDGSGETGVDLDECSYLVVKRVESSYNGTDGFEVEGCEMSAFLYLRAHHNGSHGIQLAPEDGGQIVSHHNVIAHGTFSDNEEDGINLLTSCYNRILHNVCYGNGDSGIALESEDDNVTGAGGGGDTFTGGSNGNLVKLNFCTHNDEGISVWWGSEENNIIGNTALWNTTYDLVEDNVNCPNQWWANIYWSSGGSGQSCL